MAKESVRVSAVIPATVEDIYSAWLDGERHGAFTGGDATVDARVGGRHTAWDGYIEGEILELVPPSRIVQSWRSLDFPQDAASSRLEVVFMATRGGTEVILVHTEIPEGQGADYEEGWVEHYFKPMQKYFAAAVGAAPSARPVPRAAAQPASARSIAKLSAPKKLAKKPAKKVAKPAAKKPAKKGAKPAAKKPANKR